MFRNDGKITYFKDEFACDVNLEISESKAVLKIEQGAVRMEVKILGEAINGKGKLVYVELF